MWWDASLRMIKAYLFFDKQDERITRWMERHGVGFLRLSVGLVFIWFGLMKVGGASPVAQLVASTVYWVDPGWFVPFLGAWEMLIGFCFLIRPLTRLGILLLIPQMIGTFLPLIILPAVVFEQGHLLFPTIEGLFIIKNLVIMSAAIAIGSSVRKRYYEESG